MLLDLSAAFDTLNHQQLLSALHSYGISGTALKWFESYLSSRVQRVLIAGQTSEPFSIKYGVPQGSVLGPVLFSIFTKPLSQIIETFGVSYHKYADDIQLYVTYDPSGSHSIMSAKLRLENCISAISTWMTEFGLKLNHDKTELLNILSPHQLNQYGRQSIVVDGIIIQPSKEVKSLGVIFDEHLSMTGQVTAVVKCCNFHLRNIGRIRPFLTKVCLQKCHVHVSNIPY